VGKGIEGGHGHGGQALSESMALKSKVRGGEAGGC
jgi:hypothetical protein